MTMTRQEKLRIGLEPRGLRGAELGYPAGHPVVRSDEGDVLRFADFRSLEEYTGERLDYVIASQVIQQVPDLIGWLRRVQAVLQPRGELRLAIPDPRFGSDKPRRETELPDLLAAYLRGDRRPSAQAVIDSCLNSAPEDAQADRGSAPDDGQLTPLHRPSIADCLAKARSAEGQQSAPTLNCWVFTPHRFATLCQQLAADDLIGFECWGLANTEPGENEFFVGMRPNADRRARAESWQAWMPSPWAPSLQRDGQAWSAGADALALFIAHGQSMRSPRVLELGTKRSNPETSTMHRIWVPHAAEWLGSDIAPGLDVDIVADAHRLSSVIGVERFDAVVSASTFEHFKYPHLAAHEIMKVLKVGGGLFVQTHQSFPLHGFPHDYYRFSLEALASLFPRAMGFEVVATRYEFPATVVAPMLPSTADGPAWLNTCLFARKVAPTPESFDYDLDNP